MATNNSSYDNPKIQYGLGEDDYYLVAEANIERRKAEREKRKRSPKIPIKLILFLVVVGGLIGLFVFSKSDYFVVDQIVVEGNSYYTDEEILNMAHATVGKNIIYNSDKASIEEYLIQNTYIESVKVTRSLPSTLVITVTERTQVCGITYDGDYLIIDANGILLRKTQTKPKVTIASGITVKKLTLGEKVETSDEELFEELLEILVAMEEADLYFTKIVMSKSTINAYVYDNLICKGSYTQLLDGITSGHMHSVLETLFEKSIERGTITFADDGTATFNPSIS